MNEPNDSRLVELARQGDRTAIGELFSRYWRAARAAAYGVTADWASAEDAASEGLRQALSRLDSVVDPARFPAWLRTIVVRRARAIIRSARRAGPLPPDLRSGAESDPGAAIDRIEQTAAIHTALRQLPATLREAIALHYIEGYDTEAAARLLDVPPGTLRRRLHDARKRLRTAITARPAGNSGTDDEEKIRKLFASGNLFQATREALALRSVTTGTLLREHLTVDATAMKLATDWLTDRTEPSIRAIGPVTGAIRAALPAFRDWPTSLQTGAAQIAEGEHGAFIRASQGLIRLEGDTERSVYEQLIASPNPEDFRAALGQFHTTDCLDLTWHTIGHLDLRTVQETLEQLIAAVLPGAAIRFTHYTEPRYRAAFQLRFPAVPGRAAIGGILSPWSGLPAGATAAHVRVFLNSWAALYPAPVDLLP